MPETDKLEIEVEGEGQPPVAEQTETPEEGKKPGLEVEVDENDPLYRKPDWKSDPAQNADDPTDADYSTRVQKRINKLRSSLTEAAKQRDKASRERDELVRMTEAYRNQLTAYERQLATGNASYIERQADTEDGNVKVAQMALRDALATGDPDAIAKANTTLAQATGKAIQLRTAAEFRKAQLAMPQQTQAQPQTRQPQVQQTQPDVSSDPALADFTKKNPWFNTDTEMTEAAFEVHDQLAIKGVRVGSPAYYKAIENEIKTRFPDYFGEVSKPTSPLAPTTRSNTSQQANGTSNNKIKLSASQASTAKMLGLTNEQYAAELIRLRREGVAV